MLCSRQRNLAKGNWEMKVGCRRCRLYRILVANLMLMISPVLDRLNLRRVHCFLDTYCIFSLCCS